MELKFIGVNKSARTKVEEQRENPNKGVRYFAQGTQTPYTREKGFLGV